MIKVEQRVPVYEIDGKDAVALEEVKILSHWNRPEFVVLDADQKKFTLLAGDLLAAIKNAGNTNRG